MIDPAADAKFPAVMTGGPRRRRLVASLLGVVGGAGAIGGIYLPLARLGGLGLVGCFDYSRPLVYPAITLAALTAIFSLGRCFRIVLLTTGLLCGLLAAVGLELDQNLRDALNANGGEIAQITRQMLDHSSLQSGAYVLPICGLAGIVAGFLGSGARASGGETLPIVAR